MPVNAPNDNLDVLAPSFNLKNIDDEMVSLDNAKGLNGTVIVFICNHCPYVKAIASRLKKDADDLLEHSINTIAIMSNDVINYPDDSFEKMKIFSEKYRFNFPYLYDETQEVAKNYNAVCTPDFFGFDKDGKFTDWNFDKLEELHLGRTGEQASIKNEKSKIHYHFSILFSMLYEQYSTAINLLNDGIQYSEWSSNPGSLLSSLWVPQAKEFTGLEALKAEEIRKSQPSDGTEMSEEEKARISAVALEKLKLFQTPYFLSYCPNIDSQIYAHNSLMVAHNNILRAQRLSKFINFYENEEPNISNVVRSPPQLLGRELEGGQREPLYIFSEVGEEYTREFEVEVAAANAKIQRLDSANSCEWSQASEVFSEYGDSPRLQDV